MNEDDVRASAQQVADALVAGDVDTAIGFLSDELRRNLGEVVALLPLPATEATISSVERGASAVVVVVRVTSETQEVELQTRWKDRDGTPRIVEVSHLSRVERPEPTPAGEEGAEGDVSAE
ncbi:MAG TPA: hypothetical protein VE011_00800 [Candidatus Dormibacteraeota bacterium]|nr:hypothetical protein [Candidatus Dormibacteraeota bacterium]